MKYQPSSHISPSHDAAPLPKYSPRPKLGPLASGQPNPAPIEGNNNLVFQYPPTYDTPERVYAQPEMSQNYSQYNDPNNMADLHPYDEIPAMK